MRMKEWLLSAAGVGVISIGACAAPPVNQAAEERQLMETSREWARTASTGDVDAVVNYWADDAVVMMAGLPTFTGKDAIKAYVAESFSMPGFAISWEPIEARVSASGDLGYLLERTRVTMPDRDGSPTTHEFRAVTIWRKDGGEWRNVVDISNAPPGPTTTPSSVPGLGDGA